ncbi:SDR family oxidoreductase [Kitasatospora sp. NPDC057904]|uniref:SDR family oxidoreductase n=1 Tax=Kitasatospora sp. NPDC057904 TaxID=3346275 RepID=UPI0036D787CD
MTERIILITGANKGVGFAAARELGRAGHTVLIGARDHRRGTAAAARLTAEGLDAHFVRLDVTDEASIGAAVEQVEAEHGRLDTLVNNAGITRDRQHTPDRLPVAAMREVYETNVFGVVAVTNALLPLLRKSSAGCVCNVSSGLASTSFLADPDSPVWEHATLLAYNTSKAALNAVTLVYARALREAGVKFSSVEPGFCATDLNDHTGSLTAEEGGRRIAAQVTAAADGPTGRFLSEYGTTLPW